MCCQRWFSVFRGDGRCGRKPPRPSRIEQGDRPDLFLPANFAHLARLAELGLSGSPVVFARNTMAAAVRRAANVTTGTFVDQLLDPAIRIGTSTPLKPR
ncbi:substrate-binding domain-containing protein [Mesorhizobium qingshengii]|uniref:Extracellular solute-binding protein n=1 Tax=Mesorhizobium qingshengii TaxID=1165689 RepID=A0A1G5X5F0_9HYPH|nr:substrate-binding domain-containing protein [Mesorhizobium qingshengii]SDA64825.1 extracellular solute-binding protein [Mesorhizobium qingshengii]